ncbi:MAG TPA: hypothetical protein VG272_07840 [Candidatus Acidoferrales bacterium]|nr:hypothetical protein [Candidatus Acidoferrales bacterium]
MKTFAAPGVTVLNSGNTTSPASAFSAAADFLRLNPFRALAISAAVLIPCFWHRRIEAGDLASHTYNAWLAQLTERGQAPGLWLAKQWNNVLFDMSLIRLGALAGLGLAEKICVSAAVLIFFWGAFAMISAISHRTPWSLTPCIAMFAYGWTFQQGFLNYYISLGLAFFGIALLQRGRGLERALILALLALAWMAHPLGAALLLGIGFYVVAAAKTKARNQPLLFTGAAFLLIGVSNYIVSHYPVFWPDRATLQAFLTHSGADQLLLYSARYRLPSDLLVAFVPICIAVDAYFRRKREEPCSIYALPLQLYGLAFLAGILLPSAVQLSAYAAPLGFLQARLTSVTAVFGCCLLGTVRPQKWHLPCLAAITVIFFLLLYGDTGKLNKMEEQIENYARAIPPGQRVIANIGPVPGSRLLISHIVDRACIGQCFSYGNYEPSSGQFRVRAHPGNPFVISDSSGFNQIEGGSYVVRAEDLPISGIYRCKMNEADLCMRELKVGERNGLEDVQRVATPIR